ncbi:hypothetical protein [Mycobacteroides abscessus]|uniref:hypothetical protein n=1 Tax=Mycobacteroides abscessus TaxID=36809 RepID=UPI00266BF93D|nr:hypothetical protein [Mycobacteroides abscessus]MDO3331524.1 hypothetical protein [Mycobacteroides abscessus subsp. abscessus]
MSAEKVIPTAETARLLQISIANKGRHSVHREATASAAYHFGLFADGRMSAAEAAELYTACRAGAGGQTYCKVWEFLVDQYLATTPSLAEPGVSEGRKNGVDKRRGSRR